MEVHGAEATGEVTGEAAVRAAAARVVVAMAKGVMVKVAEETAMVAVARAAVTRVMVVARAAAQAAAVCAHEAYDRAENENGERVDGGSGDCARAEHANASYARAEHANVAHSSPTWRCAGMVLS